MNTAYTKELNTPSIIDSSINVKRTSCSKEPLVFTDIYQEDVNIVTWKRDLPVSLKNSVSDFLASNPSFQSNLTVTPENVFSSLDEVFGSSEQSELVENIAELVDIFCYLFEIPRAGLRLTALDRAMCPKFHVDRVPCRLVTTYQGIATEWLSHQVVDRKNWGLAVMAYPIVSLVYIKTMMTFNNLIVVMLLY